MSTKVGILGIGDEVVDGQIVNRNAAWLSIELGQLGFRVFGHLSVRDNLDEIQQGLNFLADHCELIITTGGLGPTRDDCTRQALASWLGRDLEFSDQAWSVIEGKLKPRNVAIRPAHKNQAYFPNDSTVLDNPKGVAPGFFARGGQASLASLPGPPIELQGMWQESLKHKLIETFQPQKDRQLKTWICMGAPESEISHHIEELVDREPQVELGFRLHKPFVEVKVWHDSAQHPEQLFQSIDGRLKQWLVGETIEQVRAPFIRALHSTKPVLLNDYLTRGLLLDRVREATDLPKSLSYKCHTSDTLVYPTPEQAIAILNKESSGDHFRKVGLFPRDEFSALMVIDTNFKELPIPRNIPVHSGLGQLFAIESLFIQGAEYLT